MYVLKEQVIWGCCSLFLCVCIQNERWAMCAQQKNSWIYLAFKNDHETLWMFHLMVMVMHYCTQISNFIYSFVRSSLNLSTGNMVKGNRFKKKKLTSMRFIICLFNTKRERTLGNAYQQRDVCIYWDNWKISISSNLVVSKKSMD